VDQTKIKSPSLVGDKCCVKVGILQKIMSLIPPQLCDIPVCS